MSGLYSTRQNAAEALPLGEQLRLLREKAGVPGREVAAAAQMDSAAFSKIENGKRLPTQDQLAAMAKFFKVPLQPLEARRIVEELLRKHGDNPALTHAAAAILREDGGEYRVSKRPTAVSKPAKAVNKRGKSE
jgi:transcriptional regulator with XRE-family HTH domain